MANDQRSGSLPHGGPPLSDRFRSWSTRRWRGARNDTNIPFTPSSSLDDPPPEHVLREEVEQAMLRGDFSAAQRIVGLRLAEGEYIDTVLHLLGVVRLYQGDSASAGDCLRQALELRTESGDPERKVSTCNALARVAMHDQDYEDAWRQLDRALGLDPFSLHLHLNRLCLARDQVARTSERNLRARERLDSAQMAMASIDPEWNDEAEVNPFLLSLK